MSNFSCDSSESQNSSDSANSFSSPICNSSVVPPLPNSRTKLQLALMIAIPTGLVDDLFKAASKHLDDVRPLIPKKSIPLSVIKKVVKESENFDSTVALKHLKNNFSHIPHQNYREIIDYAKFQADNITDATVIDILNKIQKDPGSFSSLQDLLDYATLKVNSLIETIDNQKIDTKSVKAILKNQSSLIARSASRATVNLYCNN